MSYPGSLSDSVLYVERTESHLCLTLNRPMKANALSEDLVDALLSEITASYSDMTKIVVLKGNGKNFCSGFDRSQENTTTMVAHTERAMKIEVLLQLIWRAPFVTIALVQGRAIGTGADLAVACDYRIAERAAAFSFPGFSLNGALIGTKRLAEIIGGSRAFDAIFSGKSIPAEAGLDLNLVTRIAEVYEWEGLVQEVSACAGRVSKISLSALREATHPAEGGGGDIGRLVRSLAWGKALK